MLHDPIVSCLSKLRIGELNPKNEKELFEQKAQAVNKSGNFSLNGSQLCTFFLNWNLHMGKG